MSYVLGNNLDYFIVAFCRVSGFMFLLPGFASLRVPMQIRLYIAVALAAILAPNFEFELSNGLAPWFLATEITVGAVMGSLVRVYFLALNFAAVALASFIGLAAMPGMPIDTNEAQGPLSSLITLTATALIFFTGLHADMLKAIALSYDVLKPGMPLIPALLLDTYLETLQETFLLALQLSMPFLAYGVLVNLGIGLANKMSPQVPVYFISMPYVICGGLILLYALAADMLAIFVSAFAAGLRSGWL